MGFMQRFEERVSAGKNSGKTQSGAQPGFIQRFERRLGGEELSQTARDTAARYQKIFQNYDWKSGLEYDEWDEEDQQRKAAGQLPKAIEKKYDFEDPIDVYLYQNGLPPKKRIAAYAKDAETKQAATQLEQQKKQVISRNLVAPVVAGFTGIPAETLQKGLSAQQGEQQFTQQPAQKSDKRPKPYALPTPQDIEVDTVSGAAPTGRKALEQMAEDDPERKTGLYREYENPLSHQKTRGEMTAREAMAEIRNLEEEQKKIRTYQQKQQQLQQRQAARMEEMTGDPNWLFEVRKGATMELPEEFQRSNLSVYERNQSNPYADAGRYRGVHRYWDYFTQDEKNYYFYLRGKGDEEGAQAYYDDMLDELKSRWTKEDLERAKAAAQKDPFAASLESVALNVTAPIRSAPYVLKQAITQDTINPYDPSFSNALGAQAIREEVGGTIESPFLRFLYDTGMGTLDFAATAPFGEVASLAIMGTNAFANTAREASAKGATTDEAFALGLISGAAEVLTEKVGLERLYGQIGSKSSKPIRQALTEAAKSMFAEGTEEVVSEVVNTVADLLIMGDKSDLGQAKKEYMAQGLSESDAKKQALGDWLRDGLLMSYAGGAVGGLMMSGPAILVNKIATDVRIGQDIQQSGGVSETLDMARDAGVLSPVQYENAQKKAPSARKLGSIAANTASAYVEALKQAHSAADLETRLTQANEQLNTQISEIENGLPTPETEQRLAELTEQQRYLSDRLEQVKQNRIQYNEAEQVAKKLGARFELDGLNVGVGKYENGTITIDPFQANPVQKVLVHELTHHLETSGRYGEVQNMALELYSQQAGESVDQLVNRIVRAYGSQGIALDAEGAKSELTALFCENSLFQSPSSIQALAAEKPGLFQRMWQWVKDTARKVRGTAAEKQMVNLERIYREAMWDVSEEQPTAEQTLPVSEQAEAVNEQQENTDDELERIAGEILREMQGQQQSFDTEKQKPSGGKVQYSINIASDGTRFVDVESNILQNATDLSREEYTEILRDIIDNKFGNLIQANGQKIGLNSETQGEWLWSKSAQNLYKRNPEIYNDKVRAFNNADELLAASRDYVGEKPKHERTDKFVEFGRGSVDFRVDGKKGYSADVIVGIRKSGYAVLYDIVNIKRKNITESGNTSKAANTTEPSSHLSVTKRIQDAQQSVNPQQQYSLGLSMEDVAKQAQFDLISKENPALDEYHTWIRSPEEIKTFAEALQDPDWEGMDFDPDYSWQDAQQALADGEITVYSSKPIQAGAFVTPSYMEAESYAGRGQIYEARVPLSDVAWIDPTQGQFAPVSNEKAQYSLGLDMDDIAQTDTEGKQLSPEQQEFFQNSKARLLEEDGEYYLGKGNLAAVQRVESARFSGGLWNASADQIGYYFNTSKSEGAGETVYLNLQNPLTFYTFQDLIDEVTRASKLTAADFASDRDELSKKIGEQFRGYLEENGSDGAIIMEDENFGGTSFIALDPAQIYDVNDSNLPIAEQTEAAAQNIRIADTDTEGRELSPKQREFFANSAVTDENGRLKVMYHGTNADVDFTVFDAYNGAWGLFGNGLYFTDHLDVAESYTKKGRGHNPRVYEVYLDIQNPIDMDAPFDAAKWRKVQEDFRDYDFDFSRCRTNEDAFRAMEEAMTYNEVYDYEAEEEIIGALRYMGYDGITHAGGGRVSSRPKGYHTVYIAFDAEQIKSVDNRNPTKTNPDIRYSLGWTLEDLKRYSREQESSQEGLPDAEVEELPNAETARDMEPSERVEEQRKEAAQTERTAEEAVEGELIQEQTESAQEEQEQTARETAEQGDPLEEMERSDDPELSKRAKTYKKRYERKFVDAMGDVFSLDPSVKRELRTELSAIAAEAMKTGQMTEETKQRLFDEMMNRGMILNASLSESHEGALEFTKQKLSPAGLESDTRKALFGKLRYDNNGLRIDVAYQEMSEQWPDLFPADITNPNDQAKRIAEVKQELQGVRQSLMEYYGDADQYGEFRREAYNQFDKELYKLRKEMGMIERYETAARNRRQERADLIAAATDAQQARAALEQRNALRKELEKAERTTEYPLSDADRSTIRALLDGGLTEADVQGRTNAKDLLRVAEAQKAYEANEKIIKEAGKRRVRNSAELVDELLKTSDKWKDKGNFSYRRETAQRNMEDIAPTLREGRALSQALFEPIGRHAAEMTRWMQSWTKRIADLKLTKEESALVQYFGEQLESTQAKDLEAELDRLEAEIFGRKATKEPTEKTASEPMSGDSNSRIERINAAELEEQHADIAQSGALDALNSLKEELQKAGLKIEENAAKAADLQTTEELRRNSEIEDPDLDWLFEPAEERQSSEKRSTKEELDAVLEELRGSLEGFREEIARASQIADPEQNKIARNKKNAEFVALPNGKEVNLSKVSAAKIDDAIRVFRQFYDEAIDMANDAIIANGYDAVPKRQNYFPHIGEDVSGWEYFIQNVIKGGEMALPTSINGITEQFSPGKRWFANFLERKGKTTDYDAVRGFEQYLKGVSNVIFLTDDIQRLRTFESALREKYGMPAADESQLDAKTYRGHLSGLASWLHEYTNLLAGKTAKIDRSVEDWFGRRGLTFSKWLKSRFGANTVGANLSTAFSNFIPLTQGIATMNTVDLLSGMKDAAKSMIRNDGFAERSDFLTRRFGDVQKIATTNWQKVKNAAGSAINFPFEKVDRLVAESLVRGKYREELAKGLDPDSAMAAADEYAMKTMADRSVGQMPVLFQSKTLGFLTQFQLEVNNQISNTFKDIPRQYMPEKKEWAKAIPEIVKSWLALFVFSYLYNEVTEKYITGRRQAADPIHALEELLRDLGITDKDGKPQIGTAFANLAENTLDMLPMGNIITGGGRIPLASSVEGASPLDAIKKTLNGDETAGESWKDFALALGTGYLLPAGGAQLKKTVQGIRAAAEGGSYKETPDGKKLKFYAEGDAGDYVRGALFGQYALPGAKEYVEGGFKTLSVAETKAFDELRDSGLESETAESLIYELREIKSDEKDGKSLGNGTYKKRLLLLESKDLSKKQKQIIDKNLMAKERGVADYSSRTWFELWNISEKTYQKAKKANLEGISPDLFLDLYHKRKELDNEDMKAKEKATEFDLYLREKGADEYTRAVAEEYFGFYTQVRAEADQKLIEEMMP